MAFNGIIPAGDTTHAPYGLFNVADVDEKGPRDEHWGMGFSALSEACSFDSKIFDVCGTAGPADVFVKDGVRYQDVAPFGIVSFDKCISIGATAEDRKARAVRQLALISQKAVETEFWNGPFAGSSTEPRPFLASTDHTDIVSSTPEKPRIGLAMLEQALADCGPGLEGTIHMSPLVASMLGDYLVMDDNDGKVRTQVGNLVAIGAGYDGRGPGDTTPPADPYVHWMYATGKVYVILGSEEAVTVNPTDALDTKTNEMTYAAERPAAVYTDGCCQFAVQTDIRL